MAANAGALLPPGWEQVTLIAPVNLIGKFRREIAEAASESALPLTSPESMGLRAKKAKMKKKEQ